MGKLPGCSHTWHRTVRFLLRQEEMNEIDGDIMVGVDQDSCCQLQTSESNEQGLGVVGRGRVGIVGVGVPVQTISLKVQRNFRARSRAQHGAVDFFAA